MQTSKQYKSFTCNIVLFLAKKNAQCELTHVGLQRDITHVGLTHA